MIHVQQLSKSFQELKAVDGINFNVNAGEIFGFLGPNGAGKTTTIQMMSTLLKLDSGSIHIDGVDISNNPNACKFNIGVVPQDISLYQQFTAEGNLRFWGSLYQIPKNTLEQRIDELLHLIGLEDRRKDLIQNFSGGMKRRINIASALMHQPRVLFMDEPTVGVDPQSRNRIFEVVETLNKRGMTIVYTSHYMEEIERLCSKIAIMDEGRIVAQGTLSELQNMCELKEQVRITSKNLTKATLSKLHSNAFKFYHTDDQLIFEGTLNRNLPELLGLCNSAAVIIEDIEIKKVNLETIFLELTGKQLRD